MAEEQFQEKTEKPTPRKREDVRRKGQVAKSKELPSIGVLLAGLATLVFYGAMMAGRFQQQMTDVFTHVRFHDLTPEGLQAYFQSLVVLFLEIVGPFMAAVFVAAVFSNVVQVGFLFSGEALQPKFSRINPLSGIQRLFSLQSAVELVKSLLKLAIIGLIAYLAVRREMEKLSLLGEMELVSIYRYLPGTLLRLLLQCTLAMIVLAAADYAYQRWEFEKKIRMTRQELKEETKKTEGDPLIKSRIRRVQMEMARRRMMQAVPQADVVVTNPTHVAVALKYDGLRMKAPRVVAKGAGFLAERIKAVAAAGGVPLVENKPLARGLYKAVEIGSEIPEAFFQAVAEVLAYIYRLKNR